MKDNTIQTNEIYFVAYLVSQKCRIKAVKNPVKGHKKIFVVDMVHNNEELLKLRYVNSPEAITKGRIDQLKILLEKDFKNGTTDIPI